eukprot:TRINITY_DN5970_c0_g1_i1.p1 TRINITY_DN5970_c0_g1~~TRINITY_DN5970_c0_g1_i1.p1  ORF type:complete len:294 (+),score=41.26 TRINITY_DN5970_c0_g1_i1:174-1055(+)
MSCSSSSSSSSLSSSSLIPQYASLILPAPDPPKPRDHVLTMVLGYVPCVMHGSCALVSRRWRAASINSDAWQREAERRALHNTDSINNTGDSAVWSGLMWRELLYQSLRSPARIKADAERYFDSIVLNHDGTFRGIISDRNQLWKTLWVAGYSYSTKSQHPKLVGKLYGDAELSIQRVKHMEEFRFQKRNPIGDDDMVSVVAHDVASAVVLRTFVHSGNMFIDISSRARFMSFDDFLNRCGDGIKDEDLLEGSKLEAIPRRDSKVFVFRDDGNTTQGVFFCDGFWYFVRFSTS